MYKELDWSLGNLTDVKDKLRTEFEKYQDSTKFQKITEPFLRIANCHLLSPYSESDSPAENPSNFFKITVKFSKGLYSHAMRVSYPSTTNIYGPLFLDAIF